MRARILDALNTHPTNKAAADALGLSGPTLLYHIRRLGIRIETTRRATV